MEDKMISWELTMIVFVAALAVLVLIRSIRGKIDRRAEKGARELEDIIDGMIKEINDKNNQEYHKDLK